MSKCECGCGGTTEVVTRNYTKPGRHYRKGQNYKYIHGHNSSYSRSAETKQQLSLAMMGNLNQRNSSETLQRTLVKYPSLAKNAGSKGGHVLQHINKGRYSEKCRWCEMEFAGEEFDFKENN